MRSIRNNPEMARQKINLKGKSGQPTKAGIVFEEGDTVTGKIAGLKVYAQPKKTSKVVATLVRGEEVIYTGHDQGAFISVQGQDGEGWVEKVRVKK